MNRKKGGDLILTCACEKTVVMWKHPGHFTSMKKLLGAWMSLFSLCLRLSSLCDGNRRSEVMTKCFLLLVICFIILIHFCVGRNPNDTFFSWASFRGGEAQTFWHRRRSTLGNAIEFNMLTGAVSKASWYCTKPSEKERTSQFSIFSIFWGRCCVLCPRQPEDPSENNFWWFSLSPPDHNIQNP